MVVESYSLVRMVRTVSGCPPTGFDNISFLYKEMVEIVISIQGNGLNCIFSTIYFYFFSIVTGLTCFGVAATLFGVTDFWSGVTTVPYVAQSK